MAKSKPKSMSREAVKKRKQRAARKAKQQAHPEQVAADARANGTATPAESSPLTFDEQRAAVPVHITVPVEADDSPDKFTHVPNQSPAPPPGEVPVDGAAGVDPSVDAPGVDVPKPATSLGEAAMFGKLVVGYFQIGTAALFQKDPRTQQAFVGLAASLPEFQSPSGPVKLNPDQAYAALCGFIGAAAERVALKYNFRIPFVDEIAVAGAIGVATYGLIPKKKGVPGNATAAQQAKNANPAPNGTSTNPEAHAAADAASSSAPPGAVPINADNAPDLDEMH